MRELSALRAVQGWQLSVSAREESLLLASAVSANTLVGGLLFFGAVVLASLGTGASTSAALLGLITYTVLLMASNCLETFYRALSGD